MGIKLLPYGAKLIDDENKLDLLLVARGLFRPSDVLSGQEYVIVF